MSYKKQPKPTAAIKTEAKPNAIQLILFKIISLFQPLNHFQKALYYTGFPKKPSRIIMWFQEYAAAIALAEKIIIVAFIVFSILINPYLLLLLPLLGAAMYYRQHLKFLWWKVKVFIIYRNYYQDRRILYMQGSLYHHFKLKLPKRYGPAIIWGESETIQQTKFRKLQKKNRLTHKEYIHLS